jgi:DNA modification methylase
VIARSFVGLDINQNYVGIAKRRFEELIAAGEWDGPLEAGDSEPTSVDVGA